MSTHQKEFTSRDLLRAWLKTKECGDSDDEHALYYGNVYSAFSQAFNVDLNHLPSERDEYEEDRHLGIFHDFFERVAENRVSCSSPFDGILEAPSYICGLYQTYGEKFMLIQQQSESLHDKLLLELMEKIWGITEADKVSQATLDQCGYPTESAPDPYDD